MNSSRTNILDQAFDRVFCVAGAFLMSQFPRYMALYNELLTRFTTGKLSTAVLVQKKQGEVTIMDLVLKNLQEWGLKISWGRDFTGIPERIKFYQSAVAEWNQASTVEKPFVFLSNIDMNVVSYFDYTSVLQKDTQSLVYAFFGIFVGAIAYKIIIKMPYYVFIAKDKKLPGIRKKKSPKFA